MNSRLNKLFGFMPADPFRWLEKRVKQRQLGMRLDAASRVAKMRSSSAKLSPMPQKPYTITPATGQHGLMPDAGSAVVEAWILTMHDLLEEAK